MLNEGHQVYKFILCLWELLWFHFITVPVPVEWCKKSRIGLDTILYPVPVPLPQHCIHTLSPGQSRGRRPGCLPGPGRTGRAVPAAAGAGPPGPAAWAGSCTGPSPSAIREIRRKTHWLNNYKDTKPFMSSLLVFNRDIVCQVGIFGPSCKLAPLYCTFVSSSPPPPLV